MDTYLLFRIDCNVCVGWLWKQMESRRRFGDERLNKRRVTRGQAIVPCQKTNKAICAFATLLIPYSSWKVPCSFKKKPDLVRRIIAVDPDSRHSWIYPHHVTGFDRKLQEIAHSPPTRLGVVSQSSLLDLHRRHIPPSFSLQLYSQPQCHSSVTAAGA
jgi:hypothetical protein